MTGARDSVPRLLLTAEEAFPEFERAVLAAEDRVTAGFRIFDPMTLLRSEEARRIGDHWMDLILHILRKGVSFDLILSDFDPIIAPDMHLLTWSSLRKLWSIQELAGPDARFRAVPAMHPARMGEALRLAFWPKVESELNDVCKWLNGHAEEQRQAIFRDMPGLWTWLSQENAGNLRVSNRQPPPLYPVTHHQKLAVIDGRVLYLGGLDLNPRRYDTKTHLRPAGETWHDAQVIVEGPAAIEAERHLFRLLDVVAGAETAPPAQHGLCFTLSAKRDGAFKISPDPISNGIETALHREIRSSTRRVYFETQFFRNIDLAEVIAQAGRDQPHLELVMVLPAAPDKIAFEHRDKVDTRFGEHLQAKCIRTVIDAFGERCYFVNPVQRRVRPDYRPDIRDNIDGAPLVYVHAKLSVFDDRSVLVSSANLNGRSLRWDTEAGLLTADRDFAVATLERSMRHWMPDHSIDLTSPFVPQIRAAVEQDLQRRAEDRGGYFLPFDLERTEAFAQALPGIPDEMV